MPTQTLEPTFKDHYQTLQVHPEADASMIEAAYWHLARRYNAAKRFDSSAIEIMDDLNEAYSVLGSPSHRKEYRRDRNAVLGEDALPTPPPQPSQPPPLRVLERSKVRPKPVRRSSSRLGAVRLNWAS